MEEQKQTMDELLTDLTEVRMNLKNLQEKERGFKSRKMELEAKIVSSLKQQGIDRVGNDSCTLSIKEEIVPTVQDWDQVYKYLIQTKQFELIQKRYYLDLKLTLVNSVAFTPGTFIPICRSSRKAI